MKHTKTQKLTNGGDCASLFSTGTVPWVASTSSISNISQSSGEMNRSGIRGGEALTDSELEESLDDEDK
jgi:hypothetical protein